MSTSAIVMMIVTMLIVWGGLAAAMINLGRHKETTVPTQTFRDL